MLEAKRERKAQVAKMWCGGVTPKRATLPSWASDSVGDRFFSDDDIAAAAAAPPLADAILPAEEELSQDPADSAVGVFAPVAGGPPGRGGPPLGGRRHVPTTPAPGLPPFPPGGGGPPRAAPPPRGRNGDSPVRGI